MISGDHHQRSKEDLFGVDGSDLLHDGGKVRIAFDGADEEVFAALYLQAVVQRRIGGVGRMFGAVAHQHQSGVRFDAGKLLLQCLGDQTVVLERGQQRPAADDVREEVLPALGLAAQIVKLKAAHDVGRLADNGAESLGSQLFQRLLHRVDDDAIALAQLFDDHAAGEGTANLKVREGSGKVLLDGADGFFAGFLVAGAEADDQNCFFGRVQSAARREGQILRAVQTGFDSDCAGDSGCRCKCNTKNFFHKRFLQY